LVIHGKASRLDLGFAGSSGKEALFFIHGIPHQPAGLDVKPERNNSIVN
jgi:hypothetical protein